MAGAFACPPPGIRESGRRAKAPTACRRYPGKGPLCSLYLFIAVGVDRMAHLGTSMCIGVVLPQHIDVGEDEALAHLAPARGARRARGSVRGSGMPQSGG